MLPGTYNLVLYRGDTFATDFVLFTDSARTAPADLTGVTANAEIRDKSAGTLIVTAECTVTPPNTVTVTIPADLARGLIPKAVWDLQLTYPDGVVATIVAGTVTTTGDVTDSTLSPGVGLTVVSA